MSKPLASDVTAEQIEATLDKLIGQPATIGYMTADLDQQITNAAHTAAGFHAMFMVADGVPVEVAGRVAADMLLALAFNLGLVVGQELQASVDFAQMMGGVFGGPPSDAGDPEHGGE